MVLSVAAAKDTGLLGTLSQPERAPVSIARRGSPESTEQCEQPPVPNLSLPDLPCSCSPGLSGSLWEYYLLVPPLAPPSAPPSALSPPAPHRSKAGLRAVLRLTLRVTRQTVLITHILPGEPVREMGVVRGRCVRACPSTPPATHSCSSYPFHTRHSSTHSWPRRN